MSPRIALLSAVFGLVPMLSLAATTPATQPLSPPASPVPCVEVRIGQDHAGRLDCLNQALRAGVERSRPAGSGVDLESQSPDRLGEPTPAAVKQRLGNAFGHSLQPQRPPQSYAPAFVPQR